MTLTPLRRPRPQNGGPVADLGDENSMYYNEEVRAPLRALPAPARAPSAFLWSICAPAHARSVIAQLKAWVERGKEEEFKKQQQASAAPPVMAASIKPAKDRCEHAPHAPPGFAAAPAAAGLGHAAAPVRPPAARGPARSGRARRPGAMPRGPRTAAAPSLRGGAPGRPSMPPPPRRRPPLTQRAAPRPRVPAGGASPRAT